MATLTFISSFKTMQLTRRDVPTQVVEKTNNNDDEILVVNLLQSTTPTSFYNSELARIRVNSKVENTAPQTSGLAVKPQSTTAGHGVEVLHTQRVNITDTDITRTFTSLTDVYVKWTTNPKRLAQLAHETSLYTGELHSLQCSVVPRFYGHFTDDAVNPTFGCLLLEYCSGAFPDNVEEYYRQIMVLGCRLHEAGINHRQLFLSHHIIACDDSVRIVDFSLARRHRCSGATPLVRMHTVKGVPGGGCGSCEELVTLEETYGKKSGRAICI